MVKININISATVLFLLSFDVVILDSLHSGTFLTFGSRAKMMKITNPANSDLIPPSFPTAFNP